MANERVVLVTGAGKRVGAGIAQRLAQSGWTVGIHYRSSADEAAEVMAVCRSAGAKAETFCADLSEAEQVSDLVRQVEASFGRLDCLVNNASLFFPTPLPELTVEQFDQLYAVNLRAPLMLVQAAERALRTARGTVINLSDAGLQRPWVDYLAYMATKGGLDTLTAGLARALAPDVRVVGVAPGVAAWPDDYDQETRDRLTAKIPLQRAGTVEDIASLVHFLLHEGTYIDGVTIPVDGGRRIG